MSAASDSLKGGRSKRWPQDVYVLALRERTKLRTFTRPDRSSTKTRTLSPRDMAFVVMCHEIGPNRKNCRLRVTCSGPARPSHELRPRPLLLLRLGPNSSEVLRGYCRGATPQNCGIWNREPHEITKPRDSLYVNKSRRICSDPERLLRVGRTRVVAARRDLSGGRSTPTDTGSERLPARDAADQSDPSLLASRTASLSPHAAQMEMISSSAGAQHGLRVAPVTQWLQWQPVRVLEPVDRSIDASKQRRLIRDCLCLRASSLPVHRATLRHPACGHPVDIPYSIRHEQHRMGRLSRVFDSPASSAASACVPSIARVPEGPRQPYAVDAFASTGVGFPRSRIPGAARDARRRAMGRPWPPRECARHGTPGNGGPV